MNEELHTYLRYKKQFPTVWCAGCGIGTVMNVLVKTIQELDYAQDDVVVVSGIGCSSRMPVYLDFNTLHTTHGRAIAFATGIKMFRPELKVIVITGDGDGLAIGGNHLIHACRRNLDLTVVLINNFIYGMTGGQVSPSTPLGSYCYTSPYGNLEQPFDVVEIAKGAGATFIARSTSYHVMQLKQYLRQALEHKGFSIIDILAQCPTLYGRLNKSGNAVEMLKWLKSHTIPLAAAKKKKPEELKNKYVTGVFRDDDSKREYTEVYWELVRRLHGTESEE